MTELLREAATDAPVWVSVAFYGSWAVVTLLAIVRVVRKAPVLLTAIACILPYLLLS